MNKHFHLYEKVGKYFVRVDSFSAFGKALMAAEKKKASGGLCQLRMYSGEKLHATYDL